VKLRSFLVSCCRTLSKGAGLSLSSGTWQWLQRSRPTTGGILFDAAASGRSGWGGGNHRTFSDGWAIQSVSDKGVMEKDQKFSVFSF
jgi:hypothetical protein